MKIVNDDSRIVYKLETTLKFSQTLAYYDTELLTAVQNLNRPKGWYWKMLILGL
jgi:hypothetical protein